MNKIIFIKTTRTQNFLDKAIYYYHNDHLGTPEVMTNQAGNVVWEAIYQPFGEIDRYLNAKISNNFRFPGQYEDELTGLYYNHFRYYIPNLGRYNRLDPYGYLDLYVRYYNRRSFIFLKNIHLLDDQIIHRNYHYLYAICNPISYYDFNGLQGWYPMDISPPSSLFKTECGYCPFGSYTKCLSECNDSLLDWRQGIVSAFIVKYGWEAGTIYTLLSFIFCLHYCHACL